MRKLSLFLLLFAICTAACSKDESKPSAASTPPETTTKFYTSSATDGECRGLGSGKRLKKISGGIGADRFEEFEVTKKRWYGATAESTHINGILLTFDSGPPFIVQVKDRTSADALISTLIQLTKIGGTVNAGCETSTPNSDTADGRLNFIKRLSAAPATFGAESAVGGILTIQSIEF